MAAARYMAMNPVTARLVERAEDWPWSSVRAHLVGRDDRLVEVAPAAFALRRALRDLIAEEVDAALVAALRAAETIGRPLAPPAFLDRLAALAGRDRSRESAAASRGSPRRPRADGPDASLL